MTGFNIAFTGATVPGDLVMAVGQIQLGGFREDFQAEIGYWSIKDYEASWTAALRRLLAGRTVSCLVTSLPNPQIANFITTWPLYRDGRDIFVRNQLLFVDQLPSPFAPNTPWESVDPRTDDEGPVTEWNITLTDIENFLDSPTAPARQNSYRTL